MAEAPRLTDQLGSRATKRKARALATVDLKREGWEDVNKKQMCFRLVEYDRISTSSAFFKKRYTIPTLTRLSIFIEFFSPNFIQVVLGSFPQDHWAYAPHRHVAMDVKHVYLYMAVYIRIQGLQDTSTRSHSVPKHLRNHVNDAIAHFKTFEPTLQMNSTYLEYFIGNFHILSEHYELLSNNFQSIFRHVGQFLACDEKVFQFTGWHSFVLKVPAKGATGEMGLWMYQMCCRLNSGRPFMLHCKLKDAEKARGQANPVVTIVQAWINVILKFEAFLPNPDCPSVSVIDSYYFSQPVIDLFEQHPSIKFLLAATEHKFKLCEYLKNKVKSAGNWEAIYNKEHNRLLTHHYHPQEKLGRKYVLTNALTLTRRKAQTAKIIPGCDEYSMLYSICDRFNEFKDFHFPHKHGGRGHSGIFGSQHDFAVTSTLKNAINVFEDVHSNLLALNPNLKPERTNWTFQEHCTILSDELFTYAYNMN